MGVLLCGWCEEPIEGHGSRGHLHRECAIRAMVGSVAHQNKRCACYGGPSDAVPPGRTRREDARVAAALFDARFSVIEAAAMAEAPS